MGDSHYMIDPPVSTYERPAGVRPGSTAKESFRGALTGRTPTGEDATLIVTRQGVGEDERTWLTVDGAIRTTVVMTDAETVALGKLLGKAGTAS